MRYAVLFVVTLAGCSTALPVVDAAGSDAGPGPDSGIHTPVCNEIGAVPYCPSGYPIGCPNSRWAVVGGMCMVVPSEDVPACTMTGGILAVPRCTHGLPSCLMPDPGVGCP